MKTTPNLCFAPWEMKASYVEDFKRDPDAALYPVDFGAIDAPDIMAAGSVYSYKFIVSEGHCPMPTHVSRP